MWKSEPADSAIFALQLFKSERINRILIPGFGYGRNAKLFIDNGLRVSGIEISGSAIKLARLSGIECTIHHGSVTSMPFDNEEYEGVLLLRHDTSLKQAGKEKISGFLLQSIN